MTIRKQLQITNILMIVIPVILIMSVMLCFILFDGKSGGSIKVTADVLKIIDETGNKISESELSGEEELNYLKGIGKKLNSKHFKIEVLKNNNIIFTTFSPEDKEYISSISDAIISKGSFMFASDERVAYKSDYTKNDNSVRIIVINELLESGGLFSKFNRLKDPLNIQLIIISLLVILITNALLSRLIQLNIMRPLDKLSYCAKEVKNGNLDFEMNYFGDDEFKTVFKDFDEMRIKLKESVAAQEQYEKGRKELIAGISHDLSTPLTSIKGYVSGLMDGIASTPEKQERYLKTIYNTASDMEKMVEDLFISSKLDLNKLPFYFEKVELGSYFEHFTEDQAFALEKRGMIITFNNLSDSPVWVSIDRNNFRRVISNLIENSIKYKKFDPGRVDITIDSDGNKALVKVSDNGIGVEDKDLGKIFDSFYRTDPARSNPAKGSGLGLSIARQIIEQHNGLIWAEKSPDSGLTINISLPKAEEEK